MKLVWSRVKEFVKSLSPNKQQEIIPMATKKDVSVKKKTKKKKGKSRSAVTGKYVTKEFADKNRSVTVTERK